MPNDRMAQPQLLPDDDVHQRHRLVMIAMSSLSLVMAASLSARFVSLKKAEASWEASHPAA